MNDNYSHLEYRVLFIYNNTPMNEGGGETLRLGKWGEVYILQFKIKLELSPIRNEITLEFNFYSFLKGGL